MSCPVDGTKTDSDSHCFSSLEKKGSESSFFSRSMAHGEPGSVHGTRSCYTCCLRALGMLSLSSPGGE